MDYLEYPGQDFREKDAAVEFFSNVFSGVLGTRSRVSPGPVLFKRGQTSLQLVSPKLSNSHQNYPDE